jgi:hypothetical protein
MRIFFLKTISILSSFILLNLYFFLILLNLYMNETGLYLLFEYTRKIGYILAIILVIKLSVISFKIILHFD